MGNARLRDMLAHAGQRMALDLRQRLVPHRGEQGVSREGIIRDFLRSYLPKRFEVSTGFVFDADGRVSEQLDIIVADALVAPRFEVPGGIRFYPCEAVVAAGEVRTAITSRRELWDAMAQLRSVSLLDRSANGHAICYHTGERIDHTRNHLHRIFTFLLILNRAPASDLAVEVLLELIHRSESHEWPNVLVALERYLVTFACDDGVCPNTQHARGVSTVVGEDASDILLKFYLWLSQALTVTSVAQVSSWAYLDDLVRTSGQTIFATNCEEGEPPPHLSSLTTLGWDSPYKGEDSI